MDRKVPFARIVQYLMPFFASRQIFTGAGKVGAENNTEHCDYQISQRADFLETEVGLETMHSRPIINTRDEPHADPEKYRRLHVIVGDANMSEVSNYLKCGTMAIVLSMIEDDFIERDLSLESPVVAYRARVARPHLPRDHPAQGRPRPHRGRPPARVPRPGPPLLPRPRARAVGATTSWRAGARCSTGSPADPMSLDRELDWVIKRQLIENYMAKHELEWADSRVADDRPPVPRHPAGQGPLLQARGGRRGGAPGHRRRGHQGDLRSAQGHPRLLPRDVPAEVLGRGRLRVLGLGDLRPQGGPAQEDLHAGAAARHRGARPPALRPSRPPRATCCRNLGKPGGDC